MNPGSRLSPDVKRKIKAWLLVISGIVAATILVPALLSTFAAGLRGELSPGYKRIDPATCTYVLTPDRTEAFLRCPIPSGYEVPDWPDKPAPLNESH